MSFIILTGPKHAGKTSVGRELAHRLNLSFFDLDHLIEEQTGQSPRALYNAGPEIFQREEAATLAALLEKFRTTQGRYDGVLAVGGGIIDNADAMALLVNKADKECAGNFVASAEHCIVYLDVAAETAWQRITAQGELPPFLAAETPAASKEKHRLLHERRAEAYGKIARFIVKADDKNPAELADEMSRLF